MIRLLLSALLLSLVSAGSLKANDQNPSTGVIPMTSPWDANEWEPGSVSSFWRVQAPKSSAALKELKTVPLAPATTVEESGQARATAKEILSDRQTEK